MENKDSSKLGDYDNRLENIISKVRPVTTKLNDLVLKDLQKLDAILEFSTEQELMVVEIRKKFCPIAQKNNQKTYPRNISFKQVIYLKRNYLLKEGVHKVLPKQEFLHTNLKDQFFLKRGWKNCIVRILIAQRLPNLYVRHHIAQNLLKVKLQVRLALNPPKRQPVLSQKRLTPPQGFQTHLTYLLVNSKKLLNKRS